MNYLAKTVTIALILLIALSSLTLQTVKPATAQATVKPSVPEFTLKIVDHSYDVPSKTTSSTDPYTGDVTTSTIPGYHVNNKTIAITIKNQQFTPYSSDDGTNYMCYNFSYKGHYENEWQYLQSGCIARNSESGNRHRYYFQTASNYTVIELSAPTKGEMDIRVQAQIGTYLQYMDYTPIPGAPFTCFSFKGKVSGWSDAQTINVLTGSTSTASNSFTPNPTQLSTSPTSTASTNNPTSTNQISGNQSKTEEYVPMTVFLLVVAVLVAVITVLSILVLTRTRKQPII